MIVKTFKDKDLIIKLGNNSLLILNNITIETRSHSYILKNKKFIKKQKDKFTTKTGFPLDHVVSCKIIHGKEVIEKKILS